MPSQGGRCGAQQQEPAGPAVLVDEHAQDGKELRLPLDFIDNHQLVRNRAEIGFRIVHARHVGWPLHVQKDGIRVAGVGVCEDLKGMS